MSAVEKIIIDTDPGIDDSMTIFMALASSQLEVVGLTSVYGNDTIELCTRNALALLEAAGAPDIPVAVGAAKPLTTDYIGAIKHIHGPEGLGYVKLPEPQRKPVAESAHDFIASQVRAAPGEITILAIGPLTNLALLAEYHPDVVGLVKRVVIMGGNAVSFGNATPTAEANIFNDPEAADLVFGLDWDMTMVGLDVTDQVPISAPLIKLLAASSSPSVKLLGDAFRFVLEFMQTVAGLDEVHLHDPAALVYLLDPAAFETEAWPIRVETEGLGRGKTWPNRGGTDQDSRAPWRGRPTVEVCVGVDANRVIDRTLELVASYL